MKLKTLLPKKKIGRRIAIRGSKIFLVVGESGKGHSYNKEGAKKYFK